MLRDPRLHVPIFATILLLAADAHADDSPARRYARGSISLIGSATLSAGFFGGSQSGTGFDATMLTGGVAVRWITRFGLTVEPRIGVDAFLATSPSGLYAAFDARAGLGVGWTFALGNQLATTPMLSYEVMDIGGGVADNVAGVAHVVSAELPLTVLLGTRAFVEVFVRGGFVDALSQFAPAVSCGYRLGVVL